MPQTDAPAQDPQQSGAFAPHLLIDQSRSAPLILVGLPRSGSSYASHLLSHLRDWYIFDDLYLYREVKALRALSPLTPAQLTHLIGYLETAARTHVLQPKFGRYAVDPQSLTTLAATVASAFRGRSPLWYELMEEWLRRLALLHGRERWGFKTPQAFLYLPTLAQAFPDLRVLFLQRDPHSVLASYKFVRGRDGTPAQYHPVVYALYWRLASRTADRWSERMPDRFLRIRFEDLIRTPQAAIRRIEALAGCPMLVSDLSVQPNSSFSDPQSRVGLTDLEVTILRRIASTEMRQWGYEPRHVRAGPRDLLDFAAVSARFASYQASRLYRSRSGRESIRLLVQRLLSRDA